ncbi:MAG: hypothetical protein HY000_06020 [Planctomycetes bacterium]|nr:hypothetical protein [Planctomycetota bacterium]
MGEPFQLQTPFTSKVGRERPGIFGDQFKLKLDPEIEAEINALKLRMEIQKLQAAWLQPNWVNLQQLAWNLPAPLPSPQLQPIQPLPQKPLIPAPQLKLSGDGTDELERSRAATLADFLTALWKVPAVKDAGTKITDQLEKDFWKDRTTGEKVLFISWATIIAGGTISGLVGNNQSRRWALETISDKNIPVPKVDGLSFMIGTQNRQSMQDSLKDLSPGEPVPYLGYYMVVNLELTEAFPSLLKRFNF